MLPTRNSFKYTDFFWPICCIDNISGYFGFVSFSLFTQLRILFILLFCCCRFTSYSASIVALLQSPSNSIRTLNDLLASPLKLSVQDAGYTRFNFLKENDSTLQHVYKTKIEPRGKDGWIYDEYIGVEKVRTELFAFLIETPSAYKAISRTYTESEKCSLSEIHVLRLPMCTITVKRNSPYKVWFVLNFNYRLDLKKNICLIFC